MKKCPFCAEEIQDEALKCKHCGEWLEKRSELTYSTVISKLKEGVKSAYSEISEFRNRNLKPPTNDKPIKFKDVIVFPEFLIYKGNQISYDSIYMITYKRTVTYVNSLPSRKEVVLHLYVFSSLFKNNYGVIYLTVESQIPLFGIIARDKAIFTYQFISQKTFNKRLEYYLEQLSSEGFLTYPNGVKIYNNGDLFIETKKICNLKDHGAKGRVTTMNNDPFTLYILYAVVPDSNKTTFAIDISYNKDIIDLFLQMIFKEGHIL